MGSMLHAQTQHDELHHPKNEKKTYTRVTMAMVNKFTANNEHTK